MVMPLGGFGAQNPPEAKPPRFQDWSIAAGGEEKRWKSFPSIESVHSSIGVMLSNTKSPRPCVATTRSWEALTNFKSQTGAFGKSAFKGFQLEPASTEEKSPVPVPATRNPFLFGFSRTT